MKLDIHENFTRLEKAKEIDLESSDVADKKILTTDNNENAASAETGAAGRSRSRYAGSGGKIAESTGGTPDFSQRVKQKQRRRNTDKKKSAKTGKAGPAQASKSAAGRPELIVKTGKEIGRTVLTTADRFEKYDQELSEDRDILRARGKGPSNAQTTKGTEFSAVSSFAKKITGAAGSVKTAFKGLSSIKASSVFAVCVIILAVGFIVSILFFLLLSDIDEQGEGGEDIVKVALEQLGSGGTTYWSWYGFQSRQPWCACFVSWCANECGYIKSGTIPKYALCSAGSDWFKAHNKWRGREYTPEPGDIIFFFRGGVISHTGLVEKCENGKVYTIEGNTGAYPGTVRRHTYTKGAGEIYGYGTPDYPGSSSGIGSNATGNQAQKRIVAAATNGKWYGTGPGWCEAWVAAVYRNATGNGSGHCCAKASRDTWATTKGKIPVGAAIYSSDKYRSRVICSCGRNAGHVGIYIGNGKVVSMLGSGPTVQSLSTWNSWFGYGGWSWRGKKIN